MHLPLICIRSSLNYGAKWKINWTVRWAKITPQLQRGREGERERKRERTEVQPSVHLLMSWSQRLSCPQQTPPTCACTHKHWLTHTDRPEHRHSKHTRAVTPTCWNARVRARMHIHKTIHSKLPKQSSYFALPDILSGLFHLWKQHTCMNNVPFAISSPWQVIYY